MYSEYNPEDKIYFKKFRTKKLRAKSQDRITTENTNSKHKQSSRKSGNKEELVKSEDINYKSGNKEELFKSEDINSKMTSIRSESGYDESTQVKLVEYCNWLNEVVQSVENYTHEEILKAELKLKDYDDCLLPDKLKLEAADIKSARLLREMEDMLKDILQDRFMKIASSVEQKKMRTYSMCFLM